MRRCDSAAVRRSNGAMALRSPAVRRSGGPVVRRRMEPMSSLRRACGETVRSFRSPAVEPYGFTLSGKSRWGFPAFSGAWRGSRQGVASVGDAASRPSWGFTERKLVGKEAEVILSARAHLSARDRGVFRQAPAKTCGNSGSGRLHGLFAARP